MNYRQIRPSAAVAQFVECYWLLEDNAPTAAEVQRIVPDGCPELILNLSNPFEGRQDGQWRPQPGCFLVGQITGPMLVRPHGPAKVLGVRFRPQGASALLGVPMQELTGLAIPLPDLSPALFRALARLRELGSTAQQLEHVDRTLQAFAERGRAADPLVTFAVEHLRRTDEGVNVAELALRLGLSSRQLQRRFKAEVGIAAKLFGRIQRFQRVFQALDFRSPRWVNIAMQSGYYDQAHLINDFRDFSGETPAVLLSPETDLAFHFLQGSPPKNQPVSHFSKTATSSAR